MAAEAVENLFAGMNVETGCLLLVKRAERHEVGAGALEWEVTANDLNDITARTDLLDRFLGNESRHSRGLTQGCSLSHWRMLDAWACDGLSLIILA